jgi:pimeloyl-ACP methyl ester carboxylesterase
MRSCTIDVSQLQTWKWLEEDIVSKLPFLLIAAYLFTTFASFAADVAPPENLVTNADSDLYMSDATYFPAQGAKAVVLVPGFIFNKESWFPLAKTLQEKGIASLAISGKSPNHVRHAIQQLARRGHLEVILVGASSGGEAVLNAMEQVTSVAGVRKVVLLSPVRGNPLDDSEAEKLFIASSDEKAMANVQRLFDGSLEPKSLYPVEGKAHAQFLLFGENKDKVSSMIIEFIEK